MKNNRKNRKLVKIFIKNRLRKEGLQGKTLTPELRGHIAKITLEAFRKLSNKTGFGMSSPLIVVPKLSPEKLEEFKKQWVESLQHSGLIFTTTQDSKIEFINTKMLKK